MIENDSLEKRLNAVKNGEDIPKPPIPAKVPIQTTPETPQFMTYKQFLFTEGYKLFNVMSTSVLYGYGLRAIFSTDWNFIGTLGVGLLLNHSLTILLKLLKK